MSLQRSLGLGLLATCLAATAGARAQAADALPTKTKFAILKEQAATDMSTAEGAAYVTSEAQALKAGIDSAYGTCSGRLPGAKIPSLELIIGIGEDGTPQEVIPEPQDDFSACVASELLLKKFQAPPKKSFVMYANRDAKP